MMDNLFDKIDAISVTATSLPADDQHAVDNLDFYFTEELQNLDAAKSSLENLQTDSDWLKEKAEDLLKELVEARQKAREAHVRDIVAHFNKSHDLGLELPYRWEEQIQDRADDQLTAFATDWVSEQLGGKSFLEIATDKLASEFRGGAWNVKRSRRHVTLGNYVYLRDDFGGKKRLDFRADEKLYVLAKALGRFERDSTTAPGFLKNKIYEMSTGWGEEPPFGEAIRTGLTKCTDITLFKNGNLRLAFTTEAEASAFTTFYGLKLVD